MRAYPPMTPPGIPTYQRHHGYSDVSYPEDDADEDLPTYSTMRHAYTHQRRRGHDDVSYPEDDVDEDLPPMTS